MRIPHASVLYLLFYLFVAFGDVGGNGFPCEYGYNGADKRTYHHDPEVMERCRTEYCRAEATCRVYRAVVNRDSYDIYQSESETDADTSEFAPSYIGVGSAEYDKHEEECQQNFHKKSHA